MPSYTLKNIPADLYENLKSYAAIQHRSIQGEIIYRLEQSFREEALKQKQLEASYQAANAEIESDLDSTSSDGIQD